MKRILLLLAFALPAFIATAQNVGIGTALPNTSAILDVSSNDKGLLVPRMNAAQRKHYKTTSTEDCSITIAMRKQALQLIPT